MKLDTLLFCGNVGNIGKPTRYSQEAVTRHLIWFELKIKKTNAHSQGKNKVYLYYTGIV